MPRLDAFIEKLLAAPAALLVFETGKGAVLEDGNTRVRLLQRPLTSQQIVGAFAEIVPADLQKGFPRAGTTGFHYRSRGGEVHVQFEARAEGVRAVVTSGGASATAPSAAPAQEPWHPLGRTP